MALQYVRTKKGVKKCRRLATSYRVETKPTCWRVVPYTRALSTEREWMAVALEDGDVRSAPSCLPAAHTVASETSRTLPKGGLVLLCGLPAAGKSTLARRLLETGPERLRSSLGVTSVRMWHLSFDSVFNRLQKVNGAGSTFDPELWHEARESVLRATRAHCSSAPSLTGQQAPSSTAAASTRSVTSLDELAACATASKSDPASGSDSALHFDVLLLDDNMHYRSMRKAYYRIARDAQFGLCTLCLPIDVETAIERDAQRADSERVGSTTIRMMRETLQWPDLTRHPWEQNALTLEKPPQPLDEGRLWRELADAIASPVQELAAAASDSADAHTQSARDAQRTAESTLHQFDLRLRKVIASHLQSEAAQQLPGKERAALGKVLSERKKHALQQCRDRVHRQLPSPPEEGAAVGEEEEVSAAVDALEQQFSLMLRSSGSVNGGR